jgi:hypothetical protein
VHADTLEQLQKDWPAWRIWRTETMWNATRRGGLPETPRGFFSRRGQLVLPLLEDSPHELLAALERQAAIEEEAKAILALGHTGEHPITLACPIRCLGLQQGTEDALIVHWRADGIYAPTIRDLLQLREIRDLTTVPGISYGRRGEISRRLQELGLEVTA